MPCRPFEEMSLDHETLLTPQANIYLLFCTVFPGSQTSIQLVPFAPVQMPAKSSHQGVQAENLPCHPGGGGSFAYDKPEPPRNLLLYARLPPKRIARLLSPAHVRSDEPEPDFPPSTAEPVVSR